jgi:hypothetical protein
VSQETRILNCKQCGKDVVLFLIGYFNHKDKKWADEHGKLANGRTCPDCNVLRARSTMRTFRERT